MFAVGFTTGLLHDPERPAWSGEGPRPLAWSAWYPAAEGAEATPFGVPPAAPLFVMGAVAAGALDLDLWYSTKNEWLALESEVKGGRILRYERM